MKPYEGLWEDYLNLVVFLFVPVDLIIHFVNLVIPVNYRILFVLVNYLILTGHGARDPIVNLLVQGP